MKPTVYYWNTSHHRWYVVRFFDCFSTDDVIDLLRLTKLSFYVEY